MFVRQVKKKCGVRGCGSTETFAIAKTNIEIGNIFICASCLKEALDGVEGAKAEYEKRKKGMGGGVPPPLFYNPAAAKAVHEVVDEKVDEAVDDVEKAVDEDETIEESSAVEVELVVTEGFVCPECGKNFASEKGLKAHSKVHTKE